jgi:hypothetical protein
MFNKGITFLDSPRLLDPRWKLPKKHLDVLRKAWQERRLVLVLGAGVSQPYGLPNWNDLVLDALLASGPRIQLDKANPRAVASWVLDKLELSSSVLARVARGTLMGQLREMGKPATDNAFANYIRDLLYSGYHQPERENQTSMFQVISLIKRSEQSGRRIPFVITFNFDNILEMQLQAANIASAPVYSSTRRSISALPIYHPHGFLPYKGRVPRADLVFTETQYHRLTLSTFHWSSVKLFEALSEHTCLMIGLSMSDPNLRRMLDAIPHKSKTPSHFLVRKMPNLKPEEIQKAIAEIQSNKVQSPNNSIRKDGKRLLISSRNPRSFGEVLGLMMKYENLSLMEMGVAPLWIPGFGFLSQLLLPITATD